MFKLKNQLLSVTKPPVDFFNKKINPIASRIIQQEILRRYPHGFLQRLRLFLFDIYKNKEPENKKEPKRLFFIFTKTIFTSAVQEPINVAHVMQ